MNTLELDLTKQYSFADYLTWFDNVRCELYDGFIKMMSPAPSLEHQDISGKLHLSIGNYLRNKNCKIFYAPFDVRLPKSKDEIRDTQIYTVVQPDICIICDISKLDKNGCLGAPDMIIEIVSDNAKRDVEEKFQLYEKHGVREYWIVFPSEKTISVFVLNETSQYQFVGMFAENSKIPVTIFAGNLVIDLAEIFKVG